MVIPFSVPVGPIARLFDYESFVPRMDNFQQVEPLPMAARDIDEGLLDFEQLIALAKTKDDALQVYLSLCSVTSWAIALEQAALRKAESFDFRGTAA